MSLNKVILLGNITKDVEVRTTNWGNSVASFTVACSEKWTDKSGQKQEKTEFINCSAWGKTGEMIGQYFSKGSEILVQGKFTTDSYEKDGQTRYSSKVVVDQFSFTGGSKRGESSQPRESYSSPEANEFYGGGGNFTAPPLPDDSELLF